MSRASMWQMLIKTINENIESSQLDKILGLIKKDLIFDDSGIFSPGILNNSEEKLREEATVTWLVNQLIYVLSKNANQKSFQINLDLQKEILSACIVKQPWLYKNIIQKYIDHTNTLINITMNIENLIELKFFTIDNFPIENIDSSCVYRSVQLANIETKNRLMKCCIQILGHAMSLGVDLYKDSFQEATDSVLRALNESHFHVKLYCIEYMGKFVWEILDCASYDIKVILTTLQGSKTIIEKIPLWLEIETIQKDEIIIFNNNLIKFILSLTSLIKNDMFQQNNENIIKLCLEILLILCGDKFFNVRSLLNDLEVAIIKFLTTSLYKSNANITNYDFIYNFANNINKIPSGMQILEYFILDELTRSDKKPIALDVSSIWKLIYCNLCSALNCLKGEETINDNTKFNENLLLIYEILKITININHNYIIWHQIEHLKNSAECHICNYAEPTSEAYQFIDNTFIQNLYVTFFDRKSLTNLVQTFIDSIDLKNHHSLEEFCICIEISAKVLQIPISVHLTTRIQNRLIDILCEYLKIDFELSLKNPIPGKIEDLLPEFKEKVHLKCITHLFNIQSSYLSHPNQKYLQEIIEKIVKQTFQDDIANKNKENYQNLIISKIFNLITNEKISFDLINYTILQNAIHNSNLMQKFCENLKNLLCYIFGGSNPLLFKINNTDTNDTRFNVFCYDCDNGLQQKCDCEENTIDNEDHDAKIELYLSILNDNNNGIVLTYNKEKLLTNINRNVFRDIFNLLNHEEPLSDLLNSLPSLIYHLNCFDDNAIFDQWSTLFSHKQIAVRIAFTQCLPNIIKLLIKTKSIVVYEPILRDCTKKLFQSAKDCLEDSNKQLQSCVINMILKFATVDTLPESILLQLFRATFLFFIRYESCVSYEASLCASEMCSRHGVTTKDMLNWYKQDIMKLITMLCASIYLRNGVGIYKALTNISKMLGFSGPRDFIYKHYRLIVAMILPWSIKYPKCGELLEEVASTMQKDVSVALSTSFLTVYTYLFLNETPDITSRCIEFVIQNTGSSLYTLLHSDIKQTVAEILIYYHKNPIFVMQAFKNLLSQKTGATNPTEVPHSKIAEYITTRFLGVLNFFQACLVDPNFEKCLKPETLLSLGELMRFIGSKQITQFRFKIVAMLRAALTIENPDLKDVCAKAWKIFIHTVDIQSLGPLLSTIVASLEPLLQTNANEVNSIYKFLIITNGSLLSLHLPDLYFIENFNQVSEEIRIFVEQHTEKIRNAENFLDKFQFFLAQIKHENLAVRVYGLNYLSKLFAKNRHNLNTLITGQSSIHPILESVLENLMIGCRHVDRNLQLASGKCLAELGAIEPSYLPPNYAPQRNFALNIHTDSFAIMALKELCRAYQFQKDTKHVDNFSLAIQEILRARGVCPKSNRKMEVWEAIPERMRQLMEPLLTSCYTGLKMQTNMSVHPVFGSSKCQTSEEWAFVWASKMIEKINDEETQDLLNSFKPSIKRDANVLVLILPYIVLHALQSSPNVDCERIFEELQCVFQAIVKGTDTINPNDFTKTRMRGLKTIQFIASTQAKNIEEPPDYIEIKCAKLAFEQLDFLERWMREWRRVYVGHTPDKNYFAIEKFLQRFDKKLIAQANFLSGEYARALMYIESYIENNPGTLQENLSFLIEIYSELMDPDSLEGAVSLKKTELNLSEQIVVNNMTDRFLESTACFERLMQSEEISQNHIRDIVQCYLRLDTPETALLVSEGLLNQIGEKYTNDSLKEIQAEPLWRLGRFEDLENLLSNDTITDSSSWGVQCGQTLLSFRKDELDVFTEKVENVQQSILKLLRTGGAEQNSYHKGYPQVIKLHLITEVQKTKELSLELYKNQSERECLKILQDFFKEWELRLALLQPSHRITEPALCLRRILLNEMKNILKNSNKSSAQLKPINHVVNAEIGKLWIKSTELARKSGMFQQAHLCIMSAEQYQPKNLFLEKAKLFWKKGDQTNCFKVIEQKIGEILQPTDGSQQAVDNLPTQTRLLYAETKFLQATYNAESMNISTDLNLRYFKESVAGNQKSEKCLVHLAQYLDRIYASMSETEQQNSTGREILLDIMIHYGKSMSFGCEYIYQSMPRMLSIWLDYTAQQKKDDHFRKVCSKMNEIIEKFSASLPLFIFLSAFSQLVSRICHPSGDVYNVLKTIIVRLIQKFPQQSLWMILSVFKSSYPSRVKRCMEIFNDKRLSAPQMQKLINDFNSLAERLIELTNKEISSSDKRPTVSSLVRTLPRLFGDKNLSQIVMPFQQYMQITLPPIDERSSPAGAFDALPYKCVYIRGIKEEITVLQSLQKPRKVTLIGSDGKDYAVMMKPKDDLRKDFRLMEFNAVVKQYLHQDPEARERRLCIRTYAVVPLNEECGLIEWVQNLHSFRQTLMGFYKVQSYAMNAKELRASACGVRDSVEKKRDVFLKVLVPRHPPVFAEWFKHRFTTPHNWYQARSSYVRTTAVMSIVGYILGLGDRHGENILFDGSNGDTVHVDFNCLFNKGESFDYPERVPFRLTHNMVHAMGPLGVEGIYRKCCEITLRVLQAQTPTLMSVLRPFVYDPLVSWSRPNKSDGNTERTDAQAMTNVNQIEDRLKGFVKIKGRRTNMPLSTEGQVSFVISEATNVDNLAAMYIGWGSFM